MYEFKTKLGEDGRMVIPAACRRQLHLVPGEELVLRVEAGELHVLSLKHSLKKAQALVQRYAKNRSLVEKLMLMRQEDSLND